MATVLPGVLEEEECAETSNYLVASADPRAGLGIQ
jgi:hypothetical protein